MRNKKLLDFVTKRNRDAWATIRGYLYQVDVTILRWVTLAENQVLELERGEDIDVIAPAMWKGRAALHRVLEQVKRVDGSITLRSRVALESLANFYEHLQANEDGRRDLLFRLFTTAQPGHETPPAPLTFTPGILLWEKIRAGNAASSLKDDSDAVLRFLRTTRRPRGFAPETWKSFMGFLRSPGSDFLDFVRRFEWSTNAEPSEALILRVHGIIRGSGWASKKKEAASKYDQLFGYVIRLLARSPTQGRRTLTRTDLERQLARSTPDPTLAKFLGQLHDLQEFLWQKLSSMSDDISEVKATNREILARLPAQKDPTPTLERVVAPDAVLECFGSESRHLISWPQETSGRWIDRPELQKLETMLQSGTPTLNVLLGEPGCGKSALLARLAVRLRDSGVALLALKIDRLPTRVRSIQELDNEWFPACGLVDGVREIAKQQPIAILIDQLDALASLVDQQSNRLDVVIRITQVLSGIPNVRILLSCREFDYKYDARFNSVHAAQVNLADPPWEAIEPLLRERGLNPSQWPSEARAVLRKPQHLKLFLDFLASGPSVHVFSTYEAMLEEVFTERVTSQYGSPAVSTCESIAAAMATSGEIWLPRLQLDSEHHNQIDQLLAAGILREDGRLLGFQHQTMFDYVRVRSFCSGVQDLSAFVLAYQGTLFIRPILWAAMTSMRSLARGRYHKEVDVIWRNQSLRKHLRYLLISFVGQVGDPDDQETQWLLPALGDALRDKVLMSMVGSPGWFAKLSSRLPMLMRSDDPQLCWELTLLLREALDFDRQSVLDLLRRFWTDTKYDQFVLNDFREVKSWDQGSVEIVKGVVRRSKVDPFFIQQACESIVGAQPDLAADLFFTALDTHQGRSEESPENIVVSHDWYGIEKFGERAPWVVLERLWAWLRDLFADTRKRIPRNAFEYRPEGNWQAENEVGQIGLTRLLKVLLERHAVENVELFKSFVATEAGTDLMMLHRLLSYGLAKLAPLSPEVVLSYICGDTRRLNLGYYSNLHAESKRLIAALVPHLSASDAEKLEQYIMSFQYYRDFTQGDVAYRLQRRKWERMHQVELLGAFPLERLSLAGRRMRKEKGIALQSPTSENDGTFGLIGSPMTVERMEKASSREILNLFSELPDATGFDHPRNWMRGGSVQASQALGELAKRQPSKVIEVLRNFKAGEHEVPAAHGIQGLSEAPGVTPRVVVDLVHTLDKAGFQSPDFRWTVAWALERLSLRAKGLPDKTCHMLESWLEPFREIPAGQSVPETPEYKPVQPAQGAQRRKPRDHPTSLLWGLGGGGIFPRGNYPFLRALTFGLLCRDAPDTERWLATLEKHLAMREDQNVWTSLLLELRNLRMVRDVGRAADFARGLMKKQPSAFRSREGLFFLAWNHKYLPADLSERCLRIWSAGDWEGRDQAIGEFALLRSLQAADDRYSSRIVSNALSARASPARQGVRIGVAFAAVNLWREPEHRDACHQVIVRLFPLADDELSRVLMDVFRVTRSE